MTKAKKSAPAKLSAKLKGLVATAAGIGFDVATGYAAAVVLARDLRSSKAALDAAGTQYKAGYVARYLGDVPAYDKRWGNLDQAGRIDAALAIFAQPTPDSTKPNRRTEVEHKACRAADVSWSTAKRRAGIVAEKKGGRKPRPAQPKASTGKTPPVDMVRASPTLRTNDAANDYFGTAAAALLATVNKNAKHVAPAVSSAVADFHAAMKAAGIIK